MKLSLVFAFLGAACGSGTPMMSPDASFPDGALAALDGHSSDTPTPLPSYSHVWQQKACDVLGAPIVVPLQAVVHATAVKPLPVPFDFYGTPVTRFSVAEQGQLLLFDANTASVTTLVPPVVIPNTAAPNGFIAPLWSEHLFAVAGRSQIEVQIINGHGVIQWDDFAVGQFSAITSSHVTMQVRMYADDHFEMAYCALVAGADDAGYAYGARASIGIESPDGTAGVDLAFDQQSLNFPYAYVLTPQ